MTKKIEYISYDGIYPIINKMVQLRKVKIGDKVYIGNAIYKVVAQNEKETYLKLLYNQYRR